MAEKKKEGIIYTTLHGKLITEAFAELDRQLPANAYKAISGGKGGKLGLTDIVPAFLPELLLELFGPIGIGWGFSIEDMQIEKQEVQRKGGYTDTEHCVTCKINVWYAFRDGDELKQSHNIHATGGSTNTQVEWAMKGAITNALGTAWFFAGYQLAVYKAERGHNNLEDDDTILYSGLLESGKATPEEDRKVWYKDNWGKISQLSQERQAQLIEEIKTAAQQKAA